MSRSVLEQLKHNSVVRYLISGGTAFVVEYGSFLLLFSVMSAQLVVANTVSFLLGLATSFTIGRVWAFKQDEFARKAHHQVLMYVALAGLNVLISNGVIALMDYIGIDARIGKIIAIVAIAVWNFFIFKYVIFRRSSRA